jgi:tRNA (adenine37-N6)-methyltransferase
MAGRRRWHLQERCAPRAKVTDDLLPEIRQLVRRRRVRQKGQAGGPGARFAYDRDMFTSTTIGVVRTPFTETQAIPKGLGAQHDTVGTIEVLPAFEAGLADIEGFSHLYVLWEFDRAGGFDLVAMPPSDSRPHGVFATRSPRRPNPIALTVVELLRRSGRALEVRGVDMLDGTPVLDIKPYLSSVPESALRRGWLAEAEARRTRDDNR